jgi:hypothetical protein
MRVKEHGQFRTSSWERRRLAGEMESDRRQATSRRDAGAPRQQTFGLHTSTFFQVTIEAYKTFSLPCEERVTKIQ